MGYRAELAICAAQREDPLDSIMEGPRLSDGPHEFGDVTALVPFIACAVLLMNSARLRAVWVSQGVVELVNHLGYAPRVSLCCPEALTHVRSAIPRWEGAAQLGWTLDDDASGAEGGTPLDVAQVPAGQRHRIIDIDHQVIAECGIACAQLRLPILDEEPGDVGFTPVFEVEPDHDAPLWEEVSAQIHFAP